MMDKEKWKTYTIVTEKNFIWFLASTKIVLEDDERLENNQNVQIISWNEPVNISITIENADILIFWEEENIQYDTGLRFEERDYHSLENSHADEMCKYIIYDFIWFMIITRPFSLALSRLSHAD